MKRILFTSILAALFCFSGMAQTATVTLTPGAGNFLIGNTKYPLNSVIMNIRPDTSQVELDYVYSNTQNGVIVPVTKRVKYIDGRTGTPFVSIGRLKQFYDSFMVSPAFITTISGDLNILGDATAANQALQLQTLDSLQIYATNGMVTAQTLTATATYVVPAGSICIGGITTASLAKMTTSDISGESTAEKGIILGSIPASVPMQSFKPLSGSHTITAVNAVILYILKLN